MASNSVLGMTSSWLVVKTSWKTTFAGIAGSLGTAMTALENPTLVLVGKILMAISVYFLGLSARDRDVSSEAEGAK